MMFPKILILFLPGLTTPPQALRSCIAAHGGLCPVPGAARDSRLTLLVFTSVRRLHAARRRVGSRRLAGHLVLHEPDQDRDDCAGGAATHGLSEKRPDIGRTGRSGQRRNDGLKDLPAADTADGAGDRIAELAQVVVLETGARGMAADHAGDQLDDQIDERSRHDCPPSPVWSAQGKIEERIAPTLLAVWRNAPRCFVQNY